jgi:hypothetical protein
MFRYLFTVMAVLLLPLFGSAQCLTTLAPNPPFVPPAPYPSSAPDGRFWYGTDALWTALDVDGKWHMQDNALNGKGCRAKLIFWRRRGFEWRKELEPKLIITGKRPDGDAPSVAVAHANAVFVTGQHTSDDDPNQHTDARLLGTHGRLRRSHLNLHRIGGAVRPLSFKITHCLNLQGLPRASQRAYHRDRLHRNLVTVCAIHRRQPSIGATT